MDRPAQLVRYVCAALAAAAISGCGGSGGGSGAPDAGLRVVVSPSVTTLQVGEQAWFVAAVTHPGFAAPADTSVAWTVVGPSCGSITASGLYTAPGTPGTCQVHATANADGKTGDGATVEVTEDPQVVGTEYHVGPGEQLASLDEVPWSSLGPGATVYIHWRADPYRERFNVSGQGTPTAWIRVIGVLGPNGERPIIQGNGATTAQHSDFEWQDAGGSNAIQNGGVVFVSPAAGDGAPPSYVEIANLQVEGCYPGNTFHAENGAAGTYASFCPGIYARSPRHLLVRNNVLTNNALGFFNWTGASLGTSYDALDGVAVDVTLRGNHIYNNGISGNWSRHQTYTEALGVVIENNHYGPPRAGCLGSQLKDRSAGTVVRYNYMEASEGGWIMDLVEPEAAWDLLGASPTYAEDFVYGNVIVDEIWSASPALGRNFIHWNEDNQVVTGRSEGGGRLYFYHNTVIVQADGPDPASGIDFNLFNGNHGAGDCPTEYVPTGRIDARNNLVVRLPDTPGAAPVPMSWGRCGQEIFDFGVNWLTSPGWRLFDVDATASTGSATGQASIVNGGAADPFVSVAGGDFHLVAGGWEGIGGALAPAVTSNTHGRDYTPIYQYLAPQAVEARARSGTGADMGAFER